MMIVVFKCGVKQIDGIKIPDLPEHVYKWRVNEMKTKYTETGEIEEYFIVKSEMDSSEFEKIKDHVEVIKVMQYDEKATA